MLTSEVFNCSIRQPHVHVFLNHLHLDRVADENVVMIILGSLAYESKTSVARVASGSLLPMR